MKRELKSRRIGIRLRIASCLLHGSSTWKNISVETEFREKMKTISADTKKLNVRLVAREDLPVLPRTARINPLFQRFAPKEEWEALLVGRSGWLGLRCSGKGKGKGVEGGRQFMFIFLAM